MKKRILIPTLLIGTLLTGGFALAGAGFGPGNCDGGRFGQGPAMSAEEHEERLEQRLDMMSTILDLSDDQQEQIEALLQKQWSAKQQHREQMKAEREDLREQLTGSEFNEAEFRAQATKKAEQKIDRMVEHAKLKQQIFQLLTPEQQEKADTLLAMHGKGGKRRHGGHGSGF